MSIVPLLRRAPIASAERGLELLSHGLYRDIIRELAEEGPLTRTALTARLHASGTKLYECLKALSAAEVVQITRRGRSPRYAITASGCALHELTPLVTRWFASHPGRPLDPAVGWRAFADLGKSWRMVIVEWIVRVAPGDEELAAGFADLDEDQLREALTAMGYADMVELRKGRDGRPRYRLTAWAARAIGILTSLARWEQRFRPPGSIAAIEVDDAIVALLATLPLVRLPRSATGICTLTAELDRGQEAGSRFGTVWAQLRDGSVVDLGEGVPPDPATGWVSGPFAAWLSATLDGAFGGLRCDGRTEAGIQLVKAVVAEVHTELVAYE